MYMSNYCTKSIYSFKLYHLLKKKKKVIEGNNVTVID